MLGFADDAVQRFKQGYLPNDQSGSAKSSNWLRFRMDESA
jgi:hypothetical protein